MFLLLRLATIRSESKHRKTIESEKIKTKMKEENKMFAMITSVLQNKKGLNCNCKLNTSVKWQQPQAA